MGTASSQPASDPPPAKSDKKYKKRQGSAVAPAAAGSDDPHPPALVSSLSSLPAPASPPAEPAPALRGKKKRQLEKIQRLCEHAKRVGLGAELSTVLTPYHGAGGGQATRRLDIVQFNDVYNFEPSSTEDPVGGAARFAAVLNDLRKELQEEGLAPPLVVFCGDFVGPSLMSSVTRGAHMIEALNYLGVQYGTLGNHEFDYGYQSLLHRLNGVDDDVADADFGSYDYPATITKWLSTNISEGATGLPAGGKYACRTDLLSWGSPGAEIKVGLLGVSENWLPNCGQLKTGELVYTDFVEEARKAARALREQGAELVIAICHNRVEQDRKLAREVPEVDVILGGHDHFYKNDRKHRLVKSGEEFRWLTHVRIELHAAAPPAAADSKKKKKGASTPPSQTVSISVDRYDVDKEIVPDPHMDKLCAKYNDLLHRKYAKVVARSKVKLDPREEVVRFQEGTLPNFVADACAEDFSEADGLQSADFCLLTGFTFAGKEEIPAGNVTLGHITTAVRPSVLVVLKLTGEQVRRTLELGASRLPEECGGLFHVSSRLHYKVLIHPADPQTGKRTAKPTVQLADVLFDGKPLKADHVYTVGVTEGTSKGKYGFDWMKTAPRVVHEENAAQILDVVLWYCARRKGKTDGEINPTLGRITVAMATA